MALEISYTDPTDDSFYLLEFDAVMNETHGVTSTVSSHAVERGADVADFKRPGQRTISLQGIVTNTPLGDVPFSGKSDNSLGVQVQVQAVPGTVGSKAVTKQYTREFNRVKDMFDELYSLCESATLLTVATDLFVYENVQMINVSAPRTESDGESITFTVDLVQIRVVETRLVEVPTPTQPRGRPRNSRGQATTTQVDTTATPTPETGAIQFNATSSENSNFGSVFGG